ncbi:Hemin-degrading family protein [Ectothiorhodospira sp. PHS-1]|uniref:Hemin-degrading family protein n=1 Tax=Ectothiorhodospira sp. PHS-1 TaxID=519989 RepID=UPI00024A8B2C|nr:Hemin-degrading family protein [Ectothiorhodospira sp. PHS-1]EHQ52559.1 Hemin-degrading family protein [Ectothiorhodospira sp. PHS-1]
MFPSHTLDTTAAHVTFPAPATPAHDTSYLGLTESQQLALSCGRRVHRLCRDWFGIIHTLLEQPGVRCVTTRRGVTLDQAPCVHQLRVVDDTLHLFGLQQSMILHTDAWYSGFAIDIDRASGTVTRSLRFFDAYGERIFALESTAPGGFAPNLIRPFLDSRQGREHTRVPMPPYSQPQMQSPYMERLERDGIRLWWQMPGDLPVNEVPGIADLPRTRLLETLGTGYAVRARPEALHLLAECLQAQDLPMSLRLSVSNAGACQRTTGPLREANIRENSLELGQGPDARLSLALEVVETIWIVRKPGYQGEILGIECHDIHGHLLLAIDDHGQPSCPWGEWASLLRIIQPRTTAWLQT